MSGNAVEAAITTSAVPLVVVANAAAAVVSPGTPKSMSVSSALAPFHHRITAGAVFPPTGSGCSRNNSPRRARSR